MKNDISSQDLTTDSVVFDLSKSKDPESSWSAMSSGSSSTFSSLTADGLPSDLLARGPSTSRSEPQPSASIIPNSLMDLSINEQYGVTGLRAELQSFLLKVTDMEEQLHTLKQKLLHKQKYIGTLETNLKRIEGQNSNLKTEVSSLKKDNEQLRKQLHTAEFLVGPYQLPPTSPSHRKQDSQFVVYPPEKEAQLGTELDRVLQENASLRQKIIDLEQELCQTLHKLENTRQRQEQRTLEVENLLKSTNKQLQDAQSERDETARVLTDVLNKSQGASKEDSLKTQFESLLLLQKPTLSAKELTVIKDRLFAAQRQIDILESDFREEHEQRLAAERDLARMKATLRDVERECDTLRLQVQLLQEDFYREREDKQTLERNLKSKTAQLQAKELASERTEGARGWRHSEPLIYQREYLEHDPRQQIHVTEITQRISRPSASRNLRYHSTMPSDLVVDSQMELPGNQVEPSGTN